MIQLNPDQLDGFQPVMASAMKAARTAPDMPPPSSPRTGTPYCRADGVDPPTRPADRPRRRVGEDRDPGRDKR